MLFKEVMLKILLFSFAVLINYFAFSQVGDVEITDIDGNIYKTVKIGTQFWMSENLRVIHYQNGDLIDTSKPDTLDLSNSINPKYQWAYQNVDSLIKIYGRLYTWYVVVDNRNICPSGWHVPSDNEFCILENYLEPDVDKDCNKIGHRGMFIGNNLKEVGHLHWTEPETGADNKSGFCGIPQVIRTFDGSFRYPELYAYFWSTTEFDSKQAFSRRLYHDSSDINRGYYFKKDALSVRCIKD